MLDYFKYENYLVMELPLLMLICIEGMFLLISSNDLFIFYLALELQSLSLYIMASIKRYSNLSIEAGLKYFILGSFASGLLLYGISLVYGFLGSTSFYDISVYISNCFSQSDISLGILFGITFVLIGIFFKLGMVPFHF